MKCIKCSSKTKVVNSRQHKKTPSVWRRRECSSCGAVFTTNETISDQAYPFSIRDEHGKRQFSLPQLMISIFQVFSHHRAETASEESYWLAQTIAQDIQAGATDTVAKSELVKNTYDILRRYDEVAGAQYGLRHHLISLNQKPRRGRPSSARPL